MWFAFRGYQKKKSLNARRQGFQPKPYHNLPVRVPVLSCKYMQLCVLFKH